MYIVDISCGLRSSKEIKRMSFPVGRILVSNEFESFFAAEE